MNSDLRSIVANGSTWSYLGNLIHKGLLIPTMLTVVSAGLTRKGLEIARLVAEKRTQERLRRRYASIIDDNRVAVEIEYRNSTAKRRKIIWSLWLQGEENAPDLSKQCFASVRFHMPDYELVVLDSQSIDRYIDLPKSIADKYKLGIISHTHYSDIIRNELLVKYGGVWLDSTVFLTGSLPDAVVFSDLFLYQILKPGRDGHSINVSSWLIAAQAPSKILLMTRKLLFAYWEANDSLFDYYLYHHFLQLSIEAYPDEWARVVPGDNGLPHAMLLRLFDRCDEKVLSAITAQTNVHKLSNKLEHLESGTDGTYYDALLRMGLPTTGIQNNPEMIERAFEGDGKKMIS